MGLLSLHSCKGLGLTRHPTTLSNGLGRANPFPLPFPGLTSSFSEPPHGPSLPARCRWVFRLHYQLARTSAFQRLGDHVTFQASCRHVGHAAGYLTIKSLELCMHWALIIFWVAKCPAAVLWQCSVLASNAQFLKASLRVKPSWAAHITWCTRQIISWHSTQH